MRNRYSGKCLRCGDYVPAGAGHFHYNKGWRMNDEPKWLLRCKGCVGLGNKAKPKKNEVQKYPYKDKWIEIKKPRKIGKAVKRFPRKTCIICGKPTEGLLRIFLSHNFYDDCKVCEDCKKLPVERILKAKVDLAYNTRKGINLQYSDQHLWNKIS